MSTNGNAVVEQVRRILNDPDNGRPVVDTDPIRQAVVRQVALVAKELGVGAIWVPSILTLVPGTIDYTFPTSFTDKDGNAHSAVEIQTVVDLVYQRDRLPIPRRAYDEIQALRAVTVTQGRAVMACILPDPTGGLKVYLSSNPLTSEALDAFVTIVPTTWNVSDATPPTIPFSQTASRALELLVAAAVGITLGPEKLTALALNEDTFAAWKAEAMELIRQERLTVIRLKRARGPLSFAWVTAWSRYGG